MLVANEKALPHALAAVQGAGFARQRVVVWDQRNPGLGTGLRHQVGYIVVGLQPGSRTLAGRDLVSAGGIAPNAKDRYPTEKPAQLGRELAAIARVTRHEVVVDPFCGSGNLLVGAAERGARIIAGDISARAVHLARARLSAASARGRPSLDSSQIIGTRSPASAKPKRSAKPPARTKKRPGPKVRRR